MMFNLNLKTLKRPLYAKEFPEELITAVKQGSQKGLY